MGRTECDLAVSMVRSISDSTDDMATQPEHKVPDSAIARQLHASRYRIDFEPAIEIIFPQINQIFGPMQR